MAAAGVQRRGALIVFEGIDRCGKSTQCAKLVEHLTKKQVPAELWRFPDRTNLTGKIINSYLESKVDMPDEAIHLLFAANRWECSQRMLDKLAGGTTLVCDRYAFSGIVYSWAKQRDTMDLGWLKAIEAPLPAPDAVFFMNLSAEESARRGGYGGERYERTEFQSRVAACFGQLQEGDPRWVVVDAAQQVEAITEQVLAKADKVVAAAALSTSLPPRLYEMDVKFRPVVASGCSAQDASAAPEQAN